MHLLDRLGATVQRWRRPRSLGKRGEAVAARYLRRRRYVIVARSQRESLGEIDLVAIDGRTVVFVEVKTRTTFVAGHPAEAVDDDKQRRLTRSALSFLKHHDLLECSARFDVISIVWPSKHVRPRIDHRKNAFEPVGDWQMLY